MAVEESSMSDRPPSKRRPASSRSVQRLIQSPPNRSRWLGGISLLICLVLGGQWLTRRAIATHSPDLTQHSSQAPGTGLVPRSATETVLTNTAFGSTQKLTQTSQRRRNRPAIRSYSRAALDYFIEVAFGNEFSNNPDTNYIRKWSNAMRLSVQGSPTNTDLADLDRIVAELNRLMAGQMQIARVTQDANATIYFVPEAEFPTYDHQYIPRNLGFFRVWWNQKLEIQRARILISTTGINQRERSHLIREELTQSLGLMNDAETYRDSTFYQGWTDTQDFTMLDRDLIRMLYDSRVQAGMARDRIRQLFGR
ncbi:MAG: DUF2927 domain-containing protein [Oscillatoriales cyanobacterium]|nr:MAG: DUF2927 domain-containing protein [Oscillatoriales cyanobacterium]